MRRYMKNIIKQSALIILLASLGACSGISVTSDWDPGVDFSQFKSFVVLEETQPSINRLVDQRVRAAIVAELTARGLRQVDAPDKADLAIGYQITTENRTSEHTVHSGWGTRGYRSSWHTHWRTPVGTSTTTQVNFTVGTLVIAAFQMNDKELVWEGSGSGAVNPSRGPEQSKQRINDAVRQILKDFPPGATARP
ncbi:MAG: DUF4136 domain-containing protein [Thiogranum sp.]